MLSGRDRELWRLVSAAAFANPFGQGRDALDRRIARARPNDSREEVIGRLLGLVRTRLSGGKDGAGVLRKHTGEDRALLEDVVLFDVFHTFADAFDAHIQSELAHPGGPIRVPFANEALRALVSAGFSEAEASRYFATFFQLRRAFTFIDSTLPGASQSMRALRERLWSNVFTHDARLYVRVLWRKMEDFSTFLLGETGTGKGVAAAAVGRSGFIPFDTKTGALMVNFADTFVGIHLSQFPESLLESELFGHRKGAFTGAVDSHEGVLERTHAYGSIFLDEIGEASIPTQIKLLKVLEDRTFSPVGSHEVRSFRGRVIAATDRPIDAMRAEGRFRDDFFYRLCSDVVLVPTLRQRLAEDPHEIDGLIAFIVRRILGEESTTVAALIRRVVEEDLGPSYPWPGNVRELEQCARRVIVTAHFAGDRAGRGAGVAGDGELLAAVGDTDESAKGLLTRYCRALHARHGTYEEVARRTSLDRRTVKRYVVGE